MWKTAHYTYQGYAHIVDDLGNSNYNNAPTKILLPIQWDGHSPWWNAYSGSWDLVVLCGTNSFHFPVLLLANQMLQTCMARPKPLKNGYIPYGTPHENFVITTRFDVLQNPKQPFLAWIDLILKFSHMKYPFHCSENFKWAAILQLWTTIFKNVIMDMMLLPKDLLSTLQLLIKLEPSLFSWSLV